MDSLVISQEVRQQLVERRQRLQTAIAETSEAGQFSDLLQEVDRALAKIDNGTFGICETCHDPIETDRVIADPMIRNCLDHLNEKERRALEQDLDLAYQIQFRLLPPKNFSAQGWNVTYHYEPVGPVSGDYCDLILPEEKDGSFLFLIGDVSGKGVAASILMSQLHAIFRSLKDLDLPVHQLVEQANQIFCQGIMSTHFATLVCGRVSQGGEAEICNAGHCLPMMVQGQKIIRIASTGFPLGMFSETKYSSIKLNLNKGDRILLFTDGLTEAINPVSEQYGEERLHRLALDGKDRSSSEVIKAILEDQKKFRGGIPRSDDLTMMVIQRG